MSQPDDLESKFGFKNRIKSADNFQDRKLILQEVSHFKKNRTIQSSVKNNRPVQNVLNVPYTIRQMLSIILFVYFPFLGIIIIIVITAYDIFSVYIQFKK